MKSTDYKTRRLALLSFVAVTAFTSTASAAPKCENFISGIHLLLKPLLGPRQIYRPINYLDRAIMNHSEGENIEVAIFYALDREGNILFQSSEYTSHRFDEISGSIIRKRFQQFAELLVHYIETNGSPPIAAVVNVHTHPNVSGNGRFSTDDMYITQMFRKTFDRLADANPNFQALREFSFESYILYRSPLTQTVKKRGVELKYKERF